MSLREKVMKREEEVVEGWERDGCTDKKRKPGGGDDGAECLHKIRKRIRGQERGSDHMFVSLFDLK